MSEDAADTIESAPTVEAEDQQADEEKPAEPPTKGTEPPEQAELPEGEQQQEEPDLISVWNGYRLETYQWKPAGTPEGMVYVSHGVGEYMGRYKMLGEFLAENGILMFAHDHVGHGRSEGDRVHVETFNTYTADVIQHVERKMGEYPDVPCILMGHSMGGLVATDVAVQRQELFTGLILSSPGLEVDPNPGSFMVFLSRIIAFLRPQLGLIPVSPDTISSIPEEVQMYIEDPLVYHGSVKAKWGVEYFTTQRAVRPRIKVINLPVLIIHGTEDGLVPISGSQFVMDNVGSADKRFERFEGSRHEIFHDKDQEQARQMITDWILAHLTPPPQSPPEQQHPPQLPPEQQQQGEQEQQAADEEQHGGGQEEEEQGKQTGEQADEREHQQDEEPQS